MQPKMCEYCNIEYMVNDDYCPVCKNYIGDEYVSHRFSPEYRKVKTRKTHQCSHCLNQINKGDKAEFLEFRAPKYSNDDNDFDKQVGISYYREYLHPECLQKICSEQEELPF